MSNSANEPRDEFPFVLNAIIDYGNHRRIPVLSKDRKSICLLLATASRKLAKEVTDEAWAIAQKALHDPKTQILVEANSQLRHVPQVAIVVVSAPPKLQLAAAD